MTTIRAARSGDIPAIAAIRRASFTETRHATTASLEAYLQQVFFEHPWSSPSCPSFVLENGGGSILGFLGVITRPLQHHGRPLSMGVLSHFMVHPSSRGQGVGRRLMTQFLSGPQDLFWSDVANDATRMVWTAAGGHTARLHCLYWRRPISPLRHASTGFARSSLAGIAMRGARPLLGVVDAIATSTGLSASIPVPEGELAPFDPALVARSVADVVGPGVVQAVYDARALDWLMEQLRAKRELGTLEAAVVRVGELVAGWFVYFANPRGVSRVVQIAGRAGHEAAVIGHLIRSAWTRGSVTLEGRIEPAFLDALTKTGATFSREDPWVLVHARDASLLAAVQNGDTFLTRFDGEWWMGA